MLTFVALVKSTFTVPLTVTAPHLMSIPEDRNVHPLFLFGLGFVAALGYKLKIEALVGY
jgi:hypothetical protein